MTVFAPKETQEIPVEPRSGKIVAFPTNPTTPEQIHYDVASKITANLVKAGHPATVERVKAHQVFQPTSEMKQVGAEPGGGEISSKDMLRVIGEELGNTDSGTHRVVSGKGRDAVAMVRGKNLGQGQHRQNMISSLLDMFRPKKVA